VANKSIFTRWLGAMIPKADARNEAGGAAYAMSPAAALAQYAATGCLNGTYYATAEEQLTTVLALANAVEPELVAKTAIWCRAKGHMKDMPALLLATLTTRAPALFERAFPRVITDEKMLRNFVQIVRSGAVGRKSLGTMPKRTVSRWLAQRSDDELFHGSVGQSPSLGDVIKLAHPKPADDTRRALYAWLTGREVSAAQLPKSVQAFEAFKRNPSPWVPKVPFQMLTALTLGAPEWKAIAKSASWQTTRMNLQTFARHGVFEDAAMVELVAERLRDGKANARARVLPYQLLVAYVMSEGLPAAIRQALQEAMELSIANVPAFEGGVFVFPDVSGSMSSPITGHRKGATTKVRCIDVAGLIAAAVLRKNPNATVIPFAERVKEADVNPRDSVMTNAARLASLGGGGTNCSAPLELVNRKGAKGSLVIYVSDNQSWVDSGRGRGPATMQAWETFRARNPGAKLVCIDLQPYGTTQASDRADVLNVGGFSDQVFEVIAAFLQNDVSSWTRAIEQVPL
jgi:60 kDa SS-A/Ro ribonucleoprotein